MNTRTSMTKTWLGALRDRCLLALLVCALGFSAALAAEPTRLTVALYPYVPRVEQFAAAIRTDWSRIEPGVALEFVDGSEWDGGYDFDPPARADVFVFDALYFDYFRQQNWLEPLAASEIEGLDDYLPYAAEGVRVGRQYYAIPQLGCASLLFYKKTDRAVARANTLTGLKSALKQCTYTSQIPPDRRGLMIDMSGGTTNAAFYIDTAHSINGQYPYPLPSDPSEIDQQAIANLKQILSIGSYWNATLPPPGFYDFATWYSNGWGRAYVGYSESLSQMTEAARSQVAFKILPFSDNPQSRPSFYADVIAVNTSVHRRGTRALAVRLANLMASTSTMVKSIGPSGALPPQYLMPARTSIFARLQRRYPLYGELYELTTTSNPVMLKLNESSRTWLASMKGPIKTEVLSDPRCGCDYPALEQIADNRTAPEICRRTCSPYGGWSGQWTNDFPAAQSGSVCGCNSCPSEPGVQALEEAPARKYKGEPR